MDLKPVLSINSFCPGLVQEHQTDFCPFSVRFTCDPMTDDTVIISSQLLVFQLASKLLPMVSKETKISLEMGIVINLNFQPHITHVVQQQAMVQEP